MLVADLALSSYFSSFSFNGVGGRYSFVSVTFQSQLLKSNGSIFPKIGTFNFKYF